MDTYTLNVESGDEPESRNRAVQFQKWLSRCYDRYKKRIRRVFAACLLIFYIVFFAFALVYSSSDFRDLVIVTSFVLVFAGYSLIKKLCGKYIYQGICLPVKKFLLVIWPCFRWFFYVAVFIAIALYLSFRLIKDVRQLQSLLGIVVFLTIPYLTCKHPDKINWRPVVWGLAIQFAMGILVLRWRPGYEVIRWLAKLVNNFLSFALEGAAAAYGDPFFLLHAFLALVVPLIIYVGAVLMLMLHLGITDALAQRMGWLMRITMGITVIESLSLSANIYLSVVDAMLLLKPYFARMTKSEFHTFLVGSHSTIAGFAFGILTMFGEVQTPAISLVT